MHPVRNRTRGRSGIFAWQGGGRRRADARQGRQRNHAEIPPGIWSVFWPDVLLATIIARITNKKYVRNKVGRSRPLVLENSSFRLIVLPSILCANISTRFISSVLYAYILSQQPPGLRDRGTHGQHRPHCFRLMSPDFGLIYGACYCGGHCGKHQIYRSFLNGIKRLHLKQSILNRYKYVANSQAVYNQMG